MDLNTDFSQRVLIHADAVPWVPSPIAGVDRRMLDRIGGEVARATSIVRYAPGSLFPPHTHGGGEEFIVLDGVFQDEHGDYPAGSYVRNPPTSRHQPASKTGCTIFVKLWQFDPDDRTAVNINMRKQALVFAPGRPGVAIVPLFRDRRETVQWEKWEPGAEISLNVPGGAELLVLGGSCKESGNLMNEFSWLRIPVGGRIEAVAGERGAQVWIKTGGLRFVPPSSDGCERK
ncbi:MAG: cupin domain-containing protein [Blastomonas sp.]|uniref:cupin domain-containing protein n=1 Tax=Blastomonas TaxID=150203 RepID=UPI0006B9FF37|nr:MULTISPECIES: cupin domain-containing protein [unclassified Blastomonas]KPF71573.1 cupin [Blastomonas sp. AAP25]MCO5795207.1 cupin domain-containing protein [Blastomonas sp.]